ncbi:unnamed protein product [Meganyctiphanes norvegica]|uniref:C-type lectin domain-containing protein n=1 Tax=Meganyctiphanes norvegica TaxID=48144 RepID=A0AAV2R485_MEGNR
MTQVKCSSPYEYLSGKCLLVPDVAEVWNDAYKHCMGIGNGYLAKIEELALLKDWLDNKYNSRLYWLGATRKDDVWIWFTGGSFNTTGPYWMEGEGYTHNRVCLSVSASDLKYSDNTKCSDKNGFICESKPETLIDDTSPIDWKILFIASLITVFFLLVIIFGLGAYVYSLKRSSKGSTEVKKGKEMEEGHNTQGNLTTRHDSENSLYGQL